jgi:hypothetical protein
MSMPPEPTHAAIEQALHAALWQPETPAGLTAPDTGEVARRFAVYRNNVQHGLSRALAARFPAVERLVGADFFAAMARVFAAAHPPRDPVLLGWGADLPGFIAGFPPAVGLPYLADVARLELARGRAYHAADAAPVDPQRLSGADPATLRLRLHPSVQLFASAHPAVSIWAANQPGAGPAPVRARGPEQALIARAPGFAVIVEPTDPATHAVLSALAAGQPLGRAAAGADPAPALALLLRHGLITDLQPGESE